MLKMTLAFAAASMLSIAPVMAQTPATPTGKSDTKSTGMMRKGDAAKPHKMKKKRQA